MRRALFYYPVAHAPVEINPLVFELLERGWIVTVQFGWVGPDADRHAAALADLGAAVRMPEADMTPYSSHKEALITAEASASVSRTSRLPIVRNLDSILSQTRTMRKSYQIARRVIAETKPDILVASNFQSCGRYDYALLKAAKRAGVRTACVITSTLVAKCIASPGRLYQFESGMLTGNFSATSGLFRRVLARAVPAWIASDGKSKMFFFPPDQMIAAWIAGLLPSDPLHTPTADFDVVFSPDRQNLALLRDSGFPESKIRMLGRPRLDEAVRANQDPARRRAWRERCGLSPVERYVLFNVEPSFEHEYCDKWTHFDRLHALMDRMSSYGRRVLVSLHPLCASKNYTHLNELPGVTVLRDIGIETPYPDADFVVSFPCSTNKFAVAFDKSVLMYDWFGVRQSPRRWRLYNQPNLEVAESMDEFADKLRTFMNASLDVAPRYPDLAAPLIVSEVERLAIGQLDSAR